MGCVRVGLAVEWLREVEERIAEEVVLGQSAVLEECPALATFLASNMEHASTATVFLKARVCDVVVVVGNKEEKVRIL
jgi:hypothetical protein